MTYTHMNCLDQNPVHCRSVWDSAGEVVRKRMSLGSQLLLSHVRGGVYLSCYCCRSVVVVSSDEVLSKELLRSRGTGVVQCFARFDPHK